MTAVTENKVESWRWPVTTTLFRSDDGCSFVLPFPHTSWYGSW